jgi:asparagine synthase (glutamine-hydrolysing)
MLINNLVEGETLWRGVRRLSPGYRLRLSSGQVREELAYTIPFSDAYYDLPFEGHAQHLSEALRASVARIAPAGRSYGLLLSGGLDSRMLAGYLVNQGSDVRALTFGQSKDVETQCAKAVASSLGMTHDLFEVDPADYVQAAERLARWEALAGGFGAVTEWASHVPISQVGDRVVSGHMLDVLVGGAYQNRAYDEKLGRISFDAMLANFGAWGFDVPTLKALLQPELGVLVDEVLHKLRDSYQAGAQREDHRVWIFGMRNRMRYHVGGAVWVASFSAWPVLPFLSREVVATVAGMPCSSLSNRLVQNRIMMRDFPKLAQLPLDRNSPDSRPIDPRLRHHLAHALGGDFRRVRDLLLERLNLSPTERQYYRRIFDFNSSGWRGIRMRADACISRMPSALRPDAVRSMIPPVDAVVGPRGSISSKSYLRMLLGLAIWGSCNSQA